MKKKQSCPQYTFISRRNCRSSHVMPLFFPSHLFSPKEVGCNWHFSEWIWLFSAYSAFCRRGIFLQVHLQASCSCNIPRSVVRRTCEARSTVMISSLQLLHWSLVVRFGLFELFKQCLTCLYKRQKTFSCARMVDSVLHMPAASRYTFCFAWTFSHSDDSGYHSYNRKHFALRCPLALKDITYGENPLKNEKHNMCRTCSLGTHATVGEGK